MKIKKRYILIITSIILIIITAFYYTSDGQRYERYYNKYIDYCIAQEKIGQCPTDHCISICSGDTDDGFGCAFGGCRPKLIKF